MRIILKSVLPQLAALLEPQTSPDSKPNSSFAHGWIAWYRYSAVSEKAVNITTFLLFGFMGHSTLFLIIRFNSWSFASRSTVILLAVSRIIIIAERSERKSFFQSSSLKSARLNFSFFPTNKSALSKSPEASTSSEKSSLSSKDCSIWFWLANLSFCSSGNFSYSSILSRRFLIWCTVRLIEIAKEWIELSRRFKYPTFIMPIKDFSRSSWMKDSTDEPASFA